MTKLRKFYFANSLVVDAVVIASIWMGSQFEWIDFKLENVNNQISILGSLVSTDISLAGFLLAALTIIVTFKSNLKSKGMQDAENALELIFSSKHYPEIIDVFRIAIFELLICSLVLYGVLASADNFSIELLNRFCVAAIFGTFLPILRSLSVLNVILILDRHKRENAQDPTR